MSFRKGNGNNHREVNLQYRRQSEKLRVIDLFSGCGGLSLGFHSAGFEIIGGLERDIKASKSHAQNFFQGKAKQEIELHAAAIDITTTSPEQYMHTVLHAASPDGLVDVIIGGPPCQAFARIGRAKLRQIAEHPEAYLNDDRANLYLHFMEYVDYFHPLAVLIENVPDILNYGGKNVAEEIASTLEELGYCVKYTLLNAVNYGVPQFRLRFFLIAYMNELNITPEFPLPTHQTRIPPGYKWERFVALKPLRPEQKNSFTNPVKYIDSPNIPDNLPQAVTARYALADLPVLTDHLVNKKKRGARKFNQLLPYRIGRPGRYAVQMRTWPGFEAREGIVDHVIRFLPRDYEIFRLMKIDDQYPEAHKIALEILNTRLSEIENSTGSTIQEQSSQYTQLKQQYVPPYSVDKFPNKWWKMNPNMPARTLTAHIGKDTYTHIHYDSEQARVISVRDAARLQSFPDGFCFAGAMNDAYRQIGNSVPPLMAMALAKKMRTQIQQAISLLAFVYIASTKKEINLVSDSDKINIKYGQPNN